MRAPHGVAIGIHHLPVRAAVVRPPDLAAIGLFAVPRNAVACLNQRIDALRIGAGDGERVSPGLVRRQPVARQLRPRYAAIARHMETAPRSPALAAPRVDFELPHTGEDDPRVRWIHRHIRAARVLVDEERTVPCLAAVNRAEHTPLLLWAV